MNLNKPLLILICTLLYFNDTSAQITFQPGHIITAQGERIDCLIKNEDWKFNPKELEYKNSIKGKAAEMGISNIKEFTIDGHAKFVKYDVQMDVSGNFEDNISNLREPEFELRTVLLKVLIGSETASLFYYEDLKLKRFFYQKDRGSIKQFVYKVYTLDKVVYRENKYYISQLIEEFSCGDLFDASNIQYQKKDLVGFFQKYSECKNISFENFYALQTKSKVKVNLKIGYRNVSLLAENSNLSRMIDFESHSEVLGGIEIEYILPFNKNKWSLVVNPTYRGITKDDVFTEGAISQKVTLKYSSIEVPLLIRHKIFLKPSLTLFVDGGYLADFALGTAELEFENKNNLKLNAPFNLTLGAGLNLNDKIFIHARIFNNRDLFSQEGGWRSGYKAVDISIGYTFLSK